MISLADASLLAPLFLAACGPNYSCAEHRDNWVQLEIVSEDRVLVDGDSVDVEDLHTVISARLSEPGNIAYSTADGVPLGALGDVSEVVDKSEAKVCISSISLVPSSDD